MNLVFCDEVAGKLYLVNEGAVRILVALPAPPGDTPIPETKQRKWHKANRRGKALQHEIEADHQHKETRRQHPETARIEELLISGLPVPAILEKVDVSAPTVYLIKARLRKEGKLA